MTQDQIIRALLSDSAVYIHYTDEGGLGGIIAEGVIRPNAKGVVYLSQEPVKKGDAHNLLFIGAPTHAGRGTHLILIRIDLGIPVERLTHLESCVHQILRLDQHHVLYSGPNPF